MNSSSKMNLKLLSLGLGLLLTGCQPQSKPEPETVVRKVSSLQKQVVAQGVQIFGPQVVMSGLNSTFNLEIPSGVVVTEALWNFGDGSVIQSAINSLDYNYSSAGAYTVVVNVTLSTGEKGVLRHSLEVVQTNDAQLCVSDLALNGPKEVSEDVASEYSVTVPKCLSYIVNRVEWSFADGTPLQTGLTAQHAFANPGDYHVIARIYVVGNEAPYATVYLDATVNPVVPPPPAPVNECSASGLTQVVNGSQTTEEKSCGLNGKRTDTYLEKITQTCQQVGESLKWVETSRIKELIKEGNCGGQSCEFVDPSTGIKSIITDGASQTFYSSTRPLGDCGSASSTRSCQNGSLSGDSNYQYSSCHSGCGAFGVHGEVKLGVLIGQDSVAHTCSFGEPGILDVFSVVTDQTCQDGSVVNSNTRRGGLVKEGICPIYSWGTTNQYSTCTAACGGQQTLLYSCQNQSGESVPAERCVGSAPVVNRVCDADPESVRRQETTSVTEEAGQSKLCPAHKVGVVTQKREVSTITQFACVEHKVQAISQNIVQGPWVSEELCRDFGTRRCSEDSLDVDRSHERYRWMVKCAPKVKAIREFLEEFKSDEHASLRRRSMKYGKEDVYASFVHRHTGKAWVAPKKESASCDVPDDVHVATVCSADCATPEETILSQSDRSQKMLYTPFVQSLEKNYQFVAGLPDASTLSSRRVVRVPVERWVTQELDSEHDMIEFKLASGRQLKVTPHHHLVNADGSLQSAEDFKVGDSLVQLGGKLDPIVAMKPVKHYGKVYNLYVKSSSPHRNIVVTEGYLNGTAYFQSEGVKHLNKVLVRKSLLDGAFEK